ncbi:SpoIIE family protein phosphatase [uncultured Endozoicomonas sp.]|uniref:SpoIIE family protein phosphatase n=1 Tax=uncultured Endozoicomonas sp. TaxID=432652 RepID=UPI00262DAA64|nr:SpoIIE family protein phosphatase [uncultured Endozoicomonas sp.]
MEILVVEDARDQRMMLTRLLTKQGFQVYEAADGLEALAMIHDHRGIRFVVSDWMMPGMDGIELCKTIRATDFHRYIYFVLLTGNSDEEAVVEGINGGADDFLKKPVDFNELQARLNAGNRIIELKAALEAKIDAIETDLKSAADTQAQLLCDPAQLGNVAFNWYFKPSRFLGGDMFGYHELGDGHICFYQLDVAGHGIPSALLSFSLNHILCDDQHGNVVKEVLDTPPYVRGRAPDQVLSRLNEQFQAKAESMLYFSMAYGLINNETGAVSIALAGHPPPLWVRKTSASIEVLPIAGVPIGMMPGMSYSTESLQLAPGDRLFLYSDGLTECENREGEMFGEDRLKSMLKESITKDLGLVVNHFEDSIRDWSGSEVFEDDVTFLLLEWNP